MRGLLTILWHGDPDAEAVVVVCGGAMGGLLGPADGFYQWLGDEVATPGSGIGVLRVGWRRPNDIDLCTLDLLAAADLAARAGAERFVTGGHSFGGAIADPGRDGDGRLDPRGGDLRHAVGRLRGGRRASPRRCSRTTAIATRSSRRSAARWWASWSAGPADVRMCAGAGPPAHRGAATGSAAEVPTWIRERLGDRAGLRVDVDAAGGEEHGHPALRRHHPVVLRPVVVLAAAGRGVDRRAAGAGRPSVAIPVERVVGADELHRALRGHPRPAGPPQQRGARVARGGGRSCGWPVVRRRRRPAAR